MSPMDAQAILSSSPSSSSLSFSSSADDDYVPHPLIRKSVTDDRGGNGGAELGGGTSDVESEDAGFVTAEEEVLDKVHGFRPVAKVSNDDDGDEEDEEDGDFYDEEEEEEELFVNGGGVGAGEGEERSVFVVKKMGGSSEEEGGGDLVVEKQVELASREADMVKSMAMDEVLREDSGVRGSLVLSNEVVRLDNGICMDAKGADEEKKVVDGPFSASESSGAASLVHGEYAQDTEAVTMESKMGLPRELVKVEADSEAAVVPARESKVEPRADSEAQSEVPAAALGNVEHKSYGDVLLGKEKIAGLSMDDSESILKTDLPASDEHQRGQGSELETESKVPVQKREVSQDSGEDQKHQPNIEGSDADGENESLMFENSRAAQKFLEELQKGTDAHSGAGSSEDHLQMINGQIVTDSDEEADTDGKELLDNVALAALLKAATGSDSSSGSINITSQDGSRLFSVDRPAGLGSSLRSLKPAALPNRTGLFTSKPVTPAESDSKLSDEEKNILEKIQKLRMKFLRLVQRLGFTADDSLASQVLYRLALVSGRQGGQLFGLEAAKREGAELELDNKDDINFSLTVLVLGKPGVGKSAMINSILGEDKAVVHAFETATPAVNEIVGEVKGLKIRVLDTPGLKTAAVEQAENRRIFSSIKKFTKKCPPDIVLYVDRLDTQPRDLNDIPLLKSITSALGSSIWRTAVVALTHAASAPPDGPSGSPLSYDVFVAQRSRIMQQSIGQAIGDLRLMNSSLVNPVSLVENHPSCRKNRDGEKVLPNGLAWRPHLLLVCYSLKVLSEASSLSNPRDNFNHRKLFGFRVRSLPLPYLLSWLLQSRTHPKLSADQGMENGDSDVDVADLSDFDQADEEDEYDQLPPFKPLRRSQIAKLSKSQREAYFEEYDYRVKLLQKKQWREELRRMREMKKNGKVATEDYGYVGDDADPDNGSPAAVPVPLHDMVLPPSFDSDNPAYRYRFLEPTSQFIARPVLDMHGWDHDCGYDGVNLEQSLAIADQLPVAVAAQITKDKKEFNVHLDSSLAVKHGENGSTMAGFDIQNVGKQLAYIIRGESKFKNFRKNKTAAGFSVTFLGENVAAGLKVEDQIVIGKRLVLVGSAGGVHSRGDTAYGTNLEVRLREADYPIGQDQLSLGLSLVKWRGDLSLGANLQSQFSVGRGSKIAVRAGLNNKLSGQITVRTSTSEQLQIAVLGILPVISAIYTSLKPGVTDSYSIY